MTMTKKPKRKVRYAPLKRHKKRKSLMARESSEAYRLEVEPAVVQKQSETKLGYNPLYATTPFTDFASVDAQTDLGALNLNWREQDLPEAQRTKHVHRLHPYLGKFIPQLVEIFLRKFQPKTVCDPFCGSGTTLVEAKALGINGVGSDVSAFNCLLIKVKTDTYNTRKLEREVRDILERTNKALDESLFSSQTFRGDTDNAYLKRWFHPKVLNELLCFRQYIGDYEYQDVLKVVLSRAARSARLTTHFDLDFPKQPQTEPYYCYKHSRTCQPTQDARQFLNRYALDTLERMKVFSAVAKDAKVTILNEDARFADFPRFDLVVTSPPYVGLIDYHEQHRYAYELLGLPFKSEHEIGAAFKGSSKQARRNYCEEIRQVLVNLKSRLNKNGRFVIVVNDKNKLYDYLAVQCGFVEEQRLTRHVNRRTGRRAGDFFEEVLVWRAQ